MKILAFGELLLRLASPGYTKLFQKDALDEIETNITEYMMEEKKKYGALNNRAI